MSFLEPYLDQHPHHAHIPVMGTGFTMDSPLRVGRFGLRSVVSLGDDRLMERLRARHAKDAGEASLPIGEAEPDARARRVTAYLDLMDRLLARQAASLRSQDFGPASDLTRYFRLLPEGPLRQAWRHCLRMSPGPEKEKAESWLREQALPAPIEVNIMTKVDRSTDRQGNSLGPENSDAMAGLRGFARSTVRGMLVFSAGMNPRLYGYISAFDSFFPGPDGSEPRQKIALKVNDLRSAEIQGRFLAKKGIWISEWRVESGLNCGGHAFGGKGNLLGPTLEAFRQRRQSLAAELFEAVQAALKKLGRQPYTQMPAQALTAQGGLGNAQEHEFLRSHYGIESVGWGSPFLLVPEALLMDDDTLHRLEEAGVEDIELSQSSPLGVPFWNLRTSSSEAQRLARIEAGKPGSPCPQAYLTFSTELTEVPVCTASRTYMELKLLQIDEAAADPATRAAARKDALAKACICLDLGGSARRVLGESKAPSMVCPGPNLAYFKRRATLEEMLDHIYGRAALPMDPLRPYFLVKEFELAVTDLKRKRERAALGLEKWSKEDDAESSEALENGLKYYEALAGTAKGAPTAQDIAAMRGTFEISSSLR